jgi:hypothetical protein
MPAMESLVCQSLLESFVSHLSSIINFNFQKSCGTPVINEIIFGGRGLFIPFTFGPLV